MIKKDVIIVDEKDKIIGYKKRGDIIQDDIYRVSALLIKNTSGEFLLAQRSFSKKNNPGEWSFSVAGTIEVDEDYDNNIRHEIEEEIGIVNLKFEKYIKKRIYGKHNFFCQFYISTLDKNIGDFNIQKEELEGIRWFTLDELKKESFEGYHISTTLINNLELFT